MRNCQPGTLVRVRCQRWRVVDFRQHTGCAEVALAGAGALNLGVRRRVLVPFDRVEPTMERGQWKRAPARHWRRRMREWLRANTPPGALGTAHLARIDLRPHQLEPALAIVGGETSRLLLADAVGLGKTIQAALVVAELIARDTASRVLVLAPAGLRDQWASELRERFALEPVVLDAAELRRRAATLPSSVNPWVTAPMAIASIDYVKQAHVRPSVEACRWDVVVIDEAHGVAGDSDRRSVARAVAAQARYVLLLSATPHSGDGRNFQELCALGSQEDTLLVFRRSRRDVLLPAGRRVHRLPVRTRPAERRMHLLLESFGRAVRRERAADRRELWLALSVLHKRALSSPFALGRSIARRLERIGGTLASGPHPRQLALPWTDPDGEITGADSAPEWPEALALGDIGRERGWLERLEEAAREAATESSKLSALARLLRRVREPAIVFTEYRDTLQDVACRMAAPAAVLHGGLGRAERNRAIAEFTSGRRRVLLATDAAAEGLNLQHRCRLVVNLELPWNPMRLEQRVGRVDRIGQIRTVHAVHLVASGTGEERLMAYLRSKIAAAREAVGADDPLDGTDDLSMARLAIAGIPPPRSTPPHAADDCVTRVGHALRHAAHLEAVRLNGVRRLLERLPHPNEHAATGPLVGRTRHRDTRRALAGRSLWIVRASLDDRAGRRVASTLVALTFPRAARPPESWPARVARLDEMRDAALRAAEGSVTSWQEAAARAHRIFVAAARLRDERVREDQAGHRRETLFQPELYSRRFDSARRQAVEWTRARDADLGDRLDLLDEASALAPCVFDVLLVLEA